MEDVQRTVKKTTKKGENFYENQTASLHICGRHFSYSDWWFVSKCCSAYHYSVLFTVLYKSENFWHILALTFMDVWEVALGFRREFSMDSSLVHCIYLIYVDRKYMYIYVAMVHIP